MKHVQKNQTPQTRLMLFEKYFSKWKQYFTEAHHTVFTIKPKSYKQWVTTQTLVSHNN